MLSAEDVTVSWLRDIPVEIADFIVNTERCVISAFVPAFGTQALE